MKRDLDERWTKQLSNSPELLNVPDANKRKFNFCDITQVASVVKYGDNWDGENCEFVSVFPCDKNELDRRIRGVKAIRDAKGHAREDTFQERLEAATQLCWFSQVLGDNSLNPFAM